MPLEYPGGAIEEASAPPLDRDLVERLRAAGVETLVDATSRAEHGRDWWPLSIPGVAAGRVAHWPGVVARPTTTDQVGHVVRVASARGAAVTAQGGRSSVVGGAFAPDGAIALDLTGLDRIHDVDEVSGTVRVEAGVFGPDLEAHVRAKGWTVGHFPQSFELATVGGWLACRGAGQYSNRYGKIEDMVRGLTVVLASGDVVTLGGRAPRQAVGPDLVQLFVGSEGTFGVITEATLALWRAPAAEHRAAYSFGTFAEGLEACRRVLQRGARPAVLRLYDEIESRRNFDIAACALIVLDEGDPALVNATMSIVDDECAAAAREADELVGRWLEHRNDVAALAPLWRSGICVDTIEVAGHWAALAPLHESVTTALLALEGTLVASVHQSHAYLDGACLYFTFAGRIEGDATDYYRSAWDVVSRHVIDAGAALSHHHGVGRNRARFVPDALGSGHPILTGLKGLLDPTNVLNPGVLGLGGAAW
jgi:alkyldihydroxyacetonephosphate synthase